VSVLHVIFRVADGDYAVPAGEVLHMETYAGATAVPGAPPFLAGLVQVRGRVIPVVDVRARFGLAPAEPTLETHVVVVQVGDRAVGLVVDTAREVAAIPTEAIRPPPPVVGEESAGFVRAVAQLDDRLLMVIDTGRVIGEETLHGEDREERDPRAG
jgi:purine-binding chemotaxis protein CheW